MRSRREEYIERFEELTKQEIQNYNDSLLNVHSSIEGFRRTLQDCVNQYSQQVAKLNSEIGKCQSENGVFRVQIDTLSKRLDSQRNDFSRLERDKHLLDRNNSNEFNAVQSRCEKVESLISGNNAKTSQDIGNIKKLIESLGFVIERIYTKSQVDNNNLKDEILSRPCAAQKVKDEILKKLSEMSVDNIGILKEIRDYKKTTFVQEKKIENLYTLIERLQKKVT